MLSLQRHLSAPARARLAAIEAKLRGAGGVQMPPLELASLIEPSANRAFRELCQARPPARYRAKTP